MNETYKLIGGLVSLAVMDEEKFDTVERWFADPEIAFELTNTYRSLMTKSAAEFFGARLKGGEHLFSIHDTATGRFIGMEWVFHIDQVNRNAAVGICIGEKDFRGKGYGTDAMNLLLDYAFNALNLHSVHLWAVDSNERAINSYEKCGFSYAGRRRDAVTILGKTFDFVYMDILDREFKGKSFLKGFYND
ncbi:MAG: hypothetical protein A2Y33_16625 [Spirochaetes bacterium GWF1_51_8]|nr:MAG: hypothetical protein A2Y33_16625 [Spirochaetes bacterium GWF1_51_8]